MQLSLAALRPIRLTFTVKSGMPGERSHQPGRVHAMRVYSRNAPGAVRLCDCSNAGITALCRHPSGSRHKIADLGRSVHRRTWSQYGNPSPSRAARDSLCPLRLVVRSVGQARGMQRNALRRGFRLCPGVASAPGDEPFSRYPLPMGCCPQHFGTHRCESS